MPQKIIDEQMDKVSYRANIDLKYAKNLNNHETFFKGIFKNARQTDGVSKLYAYWKRKSSPKIYENKIYGRTDNANYRVVVRGNH